MTVDFDKFPVPQQLLKRERVGWSMSFDNIGKRFEYVRWGSTWEQLNKNVITVSDKINNSAIIMVEYTLYTIYTTVLGYASLNNMQLIVILLYYGNTYMAII
jgi:hypothetical protein